MTVVPVVMPHVLVTVAGNGQMTVTVNDEPHEPPPFAPPWDRASFASIIDTLLTAWRCALRVEVHESDGSTFTDIITPRKHRPTTADPTDDSPAGKARLSLLTASGEGFIPGEDVAVALVLGHSDANGDGLVRATLTTDQMTASPTGEVVLLGRVSGTYTIGRPA
jgi:hypothetical protein